MDKTYIRDLLIRGIVGINPEERINKQDILVNIELDLCIKKPGLTDDIKNAVNYKSITKQTIHIIENTKYFLIEKLATHIAEHILRNYAVESVTVTVDKPGALRFCNSVGIQITRKKEDIDNDIFLLVGSNINKDKNIRHVYRSLHESCNVAAVSSVYETLPIGESGNISDQESYYNMAFHLRTPDSIHKIKQGVCLDIETSLKRKRGQDKFMPRTIDIDIVLFNDRIISDSSVNIPDPDLINYAHSLVPLAEIAPNYIHPIEGVSLDSLAQSFKESDKITKLEFDLSSANQNES